MPLSAGDKLGPYEILAPIGAGGMGEVYKARDPRLNRMVAIKVSREQFGERFEREARAIAALNHPNIAQIYDLGENYIVMEFVDGAPLRKPESLRRLVDVTAQVADGLAAAHAAGFVHRDLKPDNILVTRSGVAKILDFGIAQRVAGSRREDQQTRTLTATDPGTVVGTIAYMSPEQVCGSAVDHRSDIFSLGVILYELLSGARPFERPTPVETMHAILKEDPPALPDNHSPSLRQVVAHALEKQAERRFQSASDLAFALRMSGTGTVIAGVAADGMPRRKWLAAGAALAGAAVVGGAGYWAGHRHATIPAPAYRELTFRDGWITRACFANDGSVVYAARWGESPFKLYHQRVDDQIAREIDVPDLSNLAAVSSNNDVAVILSPKRTLARLPLSGGAPRQLVDNVVAADWSPDGASLAIALASGGVQRIQYPIGRTLLETSMEVFSLSVSPSGDLVAYSATSVPEVRVGTVDRAGKDTLLTSFPVPSRFRPRICWRGNEVWFKSPLITEPGIIYAVDRKGSRRKVAGLPGMFFVESISSDGKLLLRRLRVQNGLAGLARGDTSERDLSWVEFIDVPLLLAENGSVCVFNGVSEGQKPVCYMRRLDGSPAVRLTTGMGRSLSPDNQWVLVRRSEPRLQSFLVPTGPGEEKPFEIEGLDPANADIVAWLPDETYVVLGNEPGKPARAYLWRAHRKELRAIGPEGPLRLNPAFVDPGRTRLLVQRLGDGWITLSIPAGNAEPVGKLPAGLQPVGWTADGRGLWVAPVTGAGTVRISRLDLSSGSVSSFRELHLSSEARLQATNLKITPDGQCYVYNADIRTSELYLAEGLVTS